jgi:hypothetical protein
MSESKVRYFPLGDVLAVVDRKFGYSANGRGGVEEVLDFVLGDYADRRSRYNGDPAGWCRSALIQQHPWLGEIQFPNWAPLLQGKPEHEVVATMGDWVHQLMRQRQLSELPVRSLV